MKIGILSDTHHVLDPQIYDYFANRDEIWHAGDLGNINLYDQLAAFKPLKAVYGNIDGDDVRTVCPVNLQFNCEGLLVWITHIGGVPPRYNKIVLPQVSTILPDLFVCGHSHILRITRDAKHGNLLYINPGAAGAQGFHKVRTLVRLEVENKKVFNVEVIELKPRYLKPQ